MVRFATRVFTPALGDAGRVSVPEGERRFRVARKRMMFRRAVAFCRFVSVLS